MSKLNACAGAFLLVAAAGCSNGPSEETVAATEGASHSWSYFHWAKAGTGELALPLGDNVSGTWDGYLRDVAGDWSRSSVIELNLASGLGGTSCRANEGRIEVCNRKYGRNGWLGLAQVWLSNGHIVRATAKVNDTYFALTQYNTPNARRHVLCQEVGHTLGLDHVDDASCMNDHGGINDLAYISPNDHDYQQLETIYAHTHDTALATVAADDGESLGMPIEKREHETIYALDLGRGALKLSWVYRAE